ncbi:RNA polymerase sigma-70 factor, ECF subfamily [Chitinophaga filiformis]|uniref:RNA polymerase sigma-70 factor, ECF subfamily n=1 Tax=Chitinophaga filiformis TaxID=104663 RepID=A0A1G8DK09_CHIFI|nr:RNA polymerase sigma-70 factor, ECF subfamily [Chitinophaga filiformis]
MPFKDSKAFNAIFLSLALQLVFTYLDITELHNERELLGQVAAGDESAFRTILRFYHPRVFSHALTFTKSYPEAEEITQDIFLRIWQQREKLPEIENFRNFLYILGRNQIISAMRKQVMKTDAAAEYPMEDMLIPDQQYQYKETYALILKAVDKLPPRQREVFTMSRLEHLSHEQIAEKLNISKAAVNWHIVQALNTLRTYLANYPEVLIFLIAIAPMY